MTKEYFYPTSFMSKMRFSPIRTWRHYIDNNDRFISWFYSCFHLKQSTKTKAITTVVVCVWFDYRAWRGFKSLNLNGNFTLSGAILFENCLLTLSACHVLSLFEKIVFTTWFMLICKGWKFLVRTWTTTIIHSYSLYLAVSFHHCLGLQIYTW